MTVPDSRRYWRRIAIFKMKVEQRLIARITELETDYDLVEAELRQLINTCTCNKEVN